MNHSQTNEIIGVPPLVILGASAGGPVTISKILSVLPENLGAAVIIIQHLDDKFVHELTSWLGKQTKLPVQLAKNGILPEKGKVYVAGTQKHLVINGNLTMGYTPYPEQLPYRPSVDVFFQSALKYWPKKSIAVLLTGMSKDGAQGLKALHDHGWYTIAQHESSCLVYGMPKAAIEMDGADDVLTVEQIPGAILAHLNHSEASK